MIALILPYGQGAVPPCNWARGPGNRPIFLARRWEPMDADKKEAQET